ncbi:zinc finger protein 454-like [Aricia agestis]|uniref:zinc finger protein 454-like n=1 Tax=Aricia agestis TaxID=91739 RepID=UPI001C209B29|nr:zinc finger protein 454-like [Aricia agestis]
MISGIFKDKYTVTTKEDGSKDFTCKMCQRVFKKQCLIYQHYVKVHLKIRPGFRGCNLCDVRVLSHLRPTHMEEAHGILRPTCNICEKKFDYQFLLLKHQRSYHMGELNFECQICSKKFEAKKGLKKHLLIHQNERPFQCTFCEKTFKLGYHLARHTRIHLNDKRFECTVCGERFVQMSSLKYHLGKRHPEVEN